MIQTPCSKLLCSTINTWNKQMGNYLDNLLFWCIKDRHFVFFNIKVIQFVILALLSIVIQFFRDDDNIDNFYMKLLIFQGNENFMITGFFSQPENQNRKNMRRKMPMESLVQFTQTQKL